MDSKNNLLIAIIIICGLIFLSIIGIFASSITEKSERYKECVKAAKNVKDCEPLLIN